ncbi:MAG: hypothetical protein QOH12_3015 [Solirubrobacteraceae bacterium]|jgi:hypothetical protein|nr:hypothetical protein [Solirubrobacteraceae bacterium]
MDGHIESCTGRRRRCPQGRKTAPVEQDGGTVPRHATPLTNTIAALLPDRALAAFCDGLAAHAVRVEDLLSVLASGELERGPAAAWVVEAPGGPQRSGEALNRRSSPASESDGATGPTERWTLDYTTYDADVRLPDVGTDGTDHGDGAVHG